MSFRPSSGKEEVAVYILYKSDVISGVAKDVFKGRLLGDDGRPYQIPALVQMEMVWLALQRGSSGATYGGMFPTLVLAWEG